MEFVDGDVTRAVIGAALAVHSELGPGFLESVYEAAMQVELERRGVRFERQLLVPIHYAGVEIGSHRLDLLVEGRVVVELKAVDDLASVHRAQVTSYLKATRRAVGLLLNFGQESLQIRRLNRRGA